MEPEGPDIVVSADRTRLLVAEVKVAGPIDSIAERLGRYMLGSGYPVGVVVAGRELRILRRDYAAGNVVEAGRFTTTSIDALEPPADVTPVSHGRFASQVQDWLESLHDSTVRNALPKALADALVDWVVPAIETGQLWAAGPRPQYARAG